MITRRKSHHPGLALPDVKTGQGVIGAAKLEGPHALKVLALEEYLRPRPAIDGSRGQHRRPMRNAFEPLRGRSDIGKNNR